MQTLAVAMATASAFERATGYYYNTADDGGMGAHYGYQMPLVAAPYHDNGHDDDNDPNSDRNAMTIKL